MSPDGSDREQETDAPVDDSGIAYRDPGTRTGSEGDGETPDDEPSAAPDDPESEEIDGGEEGEATGDEAESDEAAADPESIDAIEAIRLDSEEVVRTLAYNGQEEIGRKGKAVFSLRPPFGETVEPAIRHLDDDSTESKADGELHLRPFRFVVDGRQVVEQRPTRSLAIEELDADEPDEAAIEAWIDEAMATWKAHVRENLAESVDIFSPHGMTIVGVEYADEESDAETASE